MSLSGGVFFSIAKFSYYVQNNGDQCRRAQRIVKCCRNLAFLLSLPRSCVFLALRQHRQVVRKLRVP